MTLLESKAKYDKWVENHQQRTENIEVEQGGMKFTVHPTVFEPNVTHHFMKLGDRFYPTGGSMLDIGSGCGVIGVHAAVSGVATVVAADIVEAAPGCITENAQRHGVADKVEARLSDVFSGIKPGEKFDVIFWFHPFIPDWTSRKYTELSDVERGIRDPGLCCLRRYFTQARQFLTPHGRTFVVYSQTKGDWSTFSRLLQETGVTADIIADVSAEGGYEMQLYEIKQKPEIMYTSITDQHQRVSHAEHCVALCLLCGWKHYNLSKWVFILRCCEEVFVAQRQDGSLVGCLIRVSYNSCIGDAGTFSFFGMMLVDPDCRRQGVAMSLMEHFEKYARNSGHVCALAAATSEGFPVYVKRGYRLVGTDSTARKLTAPASIAAALQCTDLQVEVLVDSQQKFQALEAVINLDSATTGFDRTRQLKEFCTDIPGSPDSQRSLVALAWMGEEVVGALVARVDNHSGVMDLGPILGSEAAAKALIAAVGRALPTDAHVAFLVHNHACFIEELKLQGFNELVCWAGAMVLGDAKIPGDRLRYIAMMHPSLG